MKSTYLIIFICIIASFLYLGCSGVLAPVTTQPAPDLPASVIKIEKLEAHNISENMSFMSTHNDEILLLTYLMEKQANGVKIIEEKDYGSIIFDSLQTVHHLNHSYYPKKENMDTAVITFVLVELDEKNSESSIREKFRTELTNGIFLKEVEREKLDSMIGDDDFLGLKFLEMKDLSKGKETDISFKGIYLFDRFNYTLHCIGL